MKAKMMGIMVLVTLLLGSNHVPNSRFRINPRFRQKPLVFTTDTVVYKFVTWENAPFKKPPYKHWEYVNPADSLQSLESFLAFIKAWQIDLDRINDTLTAQIRPYYEPIRPISYADYNRFVAYTRDSIVRQVLGCYWPGICIKNKYGTTRLNWETPVDFMGHDIRNAIADLYYTSDDRIHTPPYNIDKRHLTYRYEFIDLVYPVKHPYLRRPDKVGEDHGRRLPFIPRNYEFIYPDTALWATPEYLQKDSTWFMAVMKADWHLNRISSNMSMWLDSTRASCYTDWVRREWMKHKGNRLSHLSFEYINLGKLWLYQQLGPEELTHYTITAKMYQEFVLYCRDSIIKNEIGGVHFLTNNSGHMRLNWDEPLVFNQETRDMLVGGLFRPQSFCCLNEQRITYYYREPDHQSFWKERDAYVHYERTFRKYGPFLRVNQSRLAEPIVPSGRKWMGLMDLENVEEHDIFAKSDSIVSELSYKQARAYWHWRLHEKMKYEKKELSDYMIPTYAEWKEIQRGTSVSGKQIEMPYPLPAFTYRVYAGGS